MKQLHNFQINCSILNSRFLGNTNCNWTTNNRVVSETVVQVYESLKRLGQEIDEANKTNKELLDHKNMSNYLEGLGKQKCGAWDDMGFSFSGNNLFPSDSQGFNGIATGQSRDWIEAAHKAYVKSGSSETFEEWCDKTKDLTKGTPVFNSETTNYGYVKDYLTPSK